MSKGFPRPPSDEESTCQCRRCRFNPWFGKIPWGRKWQPIQVFLPGKFHGQRSLAGYSPWGYKELDMTEQLSMLQHVQGRRLKRQCFPSEHKVKSSRRISKPCDTDEN